MATSLFVKLPKGTPLYHGTLAKWAKVIERDGMIRIVDHKLSGGTLDEGGLVWFTSDITLAQRFAEGWEVHDTKIDMTPGKVFNFITDRPLVFINRHGRIPNQKTADDLNELLGIPNYKSVAKGDDVDLAVYRAYASSKMPFHSIKTTDGEDMRIMWPLVIDYFGADGMVYGDLHFAFPGEVVVS